MRWKLKKKNWSKITWVAKKKKKKEKKQRVANYKNWVANQNNERNKKIRDWNKKKTRSKNFISVAIKTFLRNKKSVAGKISWVIWPLRFIEKPDKKVTLDRNGHV